jgi:hypothetical protein
MKKVIVSMLLCAAAPVCAQTPATAPAQVTPADPAALALARGIVLKIAPDGTYRQMMRGPMDQMMSSMTGQMLNVPIKQFLAGTAVSQDQIAKLNNVTARDIMAIMDPAFDQRMHITMTTMMGSMGDVLAKFEPQLREAMAEAYVHNFTLQQLTEIDHFFGTPTGTAYAARLMTLMNDPSVQASMKDLMPAIIQAMPAAAQKVQAATASLPKAKKFEDLSDADRARMAKLLGVDPVELKKAKTQ